MKYVYVTTRGEDQEGGTVIAVHSTKLAAIRSVENGYDGGRLGGPPMSRAPTATLDMDVVARWSDHGDYVEITRWPVWSRAKPRPR